MLEFEAFMPDFAALYSLKCRSLPILLSGGPDTQASYAPNVQAACQLGPAGLPSVASPHEQRERLDIPRARVGQRPPGTS
jgi:hypothetical protein